MAKHPIILALFSGAGGRMILYRPGQPPEEAPSVPIVYQVMKSTGHSTMAISEVVMPYVGNAADKSWMAPMLAYRTQMKTALDGVDALPIQDDWKPAVKNILGNNVAYMDDCLAKGVITMEALQAFAKKQGPDIKLIINWAASTQVKHWMGVLDGWKASLGPDLDKTYAASNTIYVARQNNVLFSMLAQYFAPEAINDRLMLIETDLVHHHAAGHADLDGPHHLRPLGRRTVLRQRQADGFRADGWRRAQDHHLGDAAARQAALPAARRAVRLPAVADADHAAARARPRSTT